MEKQIKTRKVQVYVNEKDKELFEKHYNSLRNFQNISCKLSNDIMNIKIAAYNAPLLYLRSGKHKNENYISLCSQITKLRNEESKLKGQSRKNIRDEIKKKLKERSEIEINFRKNMIEELETSEQNLCYKLSTKEYDELPSTIKSALSQKITKDFKNSTKDVLIGKKTYSSYKSTNPVFFLSPSISKFQKEEKGKDFVFNLFGIPMKTRLGRDASNNEIIFDRVLSGEYKIKTSSYRFVDDKMFLYFCIEMDKKIQDTNDRKDGVIMGIDLGVKQPICISVSSHKYPIYVGNTYSVSEMKKRSESERRGAAKIAKDSKTGHGRKRAMKKFTQIKQREKNQTDSIFHKYSKEVVDIAIRYKVSKIVMEDLSFGLDKQKLLKTFAPNKLQNFIETKAKPNNIEVVYINPAYTSQTCSECGFLDKDNRETRDNFVCKSCNYNSNADFNAAKNIIKKSTEKKVDDFLGF